MNKLVSLLRSPYPVLFQRWKSVVIPSAIVAFILYAFQPFGISLKEGSKLGIAIGSGALRRERLSSAIICCRHCFLLTIKSSIGRWANMSWTCFCSSF